VTARNRDGAIVDANLLPIDSRPPRVPLVNPANMRLATLACLLLIAAIALPIVNKASVIAQLTPRVEAAGAAAREGSRIRDNIESLHTAAQSLVQRKSTDPMILELLDATTEVVPDTTWITEFEVQGRRVRINGESAMAASLIELFDQAESFVDPEFSAPVTRVRNSDRERFDLSVEWLEGEGS
jgi:general secretion pathway protein L